MSITDNSKPATRSSGTWRFDASSAAPQCYTPPKLRLPRLRPDGRHGLGVMPGQITVAELKAKVAAP